MNGLKEANPICLYNHCAIKSGFRRGVRTARNKSFTPSGSEQAIQTKHNQSWSMATSNLALGVSVALFLLLWAGAGHCQVSYVRHLSELRIKELKDLAVRLQNSINPDKYACESYFDYVCSRNRPLFSIMGMLTWGV